MSLPDHNPACVDCLTTIPAGVDCLTSGTQCRQICTIHQWLCIVGSSAGAVQLTVDPHDGLKCVLATPIMAMTVDQACSWHLSICTTKFEQLLQINHDPGRPPWTQPWEVSVLTPGAVGFAIITGFSTYICYKRIVKPLVLQRMWARRKQTNRQQGTEALDIEVAQRGLQRMSAAFAQKLVPQHRPVMSRLRALLSPSSVFYSQLADQPSSLDQPGSSSQALDDPAAELEGSVHAAEGGADPSHPHLKGRDAHLPWGVRYMGLSKDICTPRLYLSLSLYP